MLLNNNIFVDEAVIQECLEDLTDGISCNRGRRRSRSGSRSTSGRGKTRSGLKSKMVDRLINDKVNIDPSNCQVDCERILLRTKAKSKSVKKRRKQCDCFCTEYLTCLSLRTTGKLLAIMMLSAISSFNNIQYMTSVIIMLFIIIIRNYNYISDYHSTHDN